MEQILQNNKMLLISEHTQETQYCILSLIQSLTRKCSLLVTEDTRCTVTPLISQLTLLC